MTSSDPSFEVRPVGLPAVALLAALHAESFAARSATERLGESDLASLLAMPGAFALLASSGLTPLGFALARCVVEECELLTIAVGAEKRRGGVGGALLRAVCDQAARAGAERIFLDVATDNEPARMLYAAAGFKTVGRRKSYYQSEVGPAVDALIMARPISRPSVPQRRPAGSRPEA